MPATLSILTNVFRDPEERGRAIAVWAGFSGLGVAIGPMTGGMLLEHFSWQSVFWVNLPIGITALILGLIFVPTSRDPSQSKLDPIGAVLSFVGLGTLLFGIIEGPAKGWTEPLVLGSFALAIAAIGGVHRLGTAHRLPDARPVGVQEPPLQCRQRHDHHRLLRPHGVVVPHDAVLAAGPRLHAAPGRCAPVAVRGHDDDRGPDVGPVGGAARHEAGRPDGPVAGHDRPLLLSTIAADSPYPMVISFFMVMACGMGMTMAPATESVMGSLPRSKAGVGSAINDTTRQVGGALGIAIIGSVVSSVYASPASAAHRRRSGSTAPEARDGRVVPRRRPGRGRFARQ